MHFPMALTSITVPREGLAMAKPLLTLLVTFPPSFLNIVSVFFWLLFCFHANIKKPILHGFLCFYCPFVAIRLGLPMPPPYLGVPKFERHKVITGLNYASGSCGILNSTRAVRFKINKYRV